MARSRAKIGCMIGIGALLLVLLVAVLGGGALWWQTGRVKRQMLEQYVVIAEISQSRTYSRDPKTPGWALEPGDAADLYQEAWGACDLENPPSDVRDSLSDALSAYTGAPTRTPGTAIRPLQEPGSHPVWEPCRNAGVPDVPDDPLVSQLTPDACDAYAACWPALELVRRGSRRTGTASPVHLWSSWSSQHESGYRSLIPFMQLAKMELLAGYVAGLHGDAWAPAESSLTVLRFGHDLGQGAGLVGTMVGVVNQNSAADVLATLLAADALPAAERERLARELNYVNRHHFSIAEAVEGEFLALGALWVHGETTVPPSALLPVDQGDVFERMQMARWAEEQLKLADELLPILETPFPERIAAYDAMIEGADDAWMFPDYTAYDVRITATRTRLLMLEIAAADGAFRAGQGRAPADLDELAATYPDLPRTDPLTGDSFVLETVGGRRILRSQALGADGDPARLERIPTSIRVEGALRIELAAGVL